MPDNYNIVSLVLFTALILATGCGAPDDDELITGKQLLTGNLAVDSFDSQSEIFVIDEHDTEYRFPTSIDGRFTITLPAGELYKIYILDAHDHDRDDAQLMVFPRAHGEIDHFIFIAGEAAPFELGEVRSAGTYETAEFYVEQANTSANYRQNDEASASRPSEQPSHVEQLRECEVFASESRAHCVIDGIHPGCKGLRIAAERRTSAANRAHEVHQTAASVTHDSRPDDIGHLRSDNLRHAHAENSEAIRPEQYIAVVQLSPPAIFTACNK